jgi:regulator of sigma E protease
MSFVWTLIQFVIVLGLLLFFHEFGHFIISRLFKIEVDEFGFGFPPRLAKLFRWRNTDFTINWIPFGAFVRPKGENDPNVEGGMAAASPWARLAVLLGGPGMNILIGILILGVMFMSIGKVNPAIVQIMDVAPGTPAEQAGLKSSDIVLQVNQDKIDSMQTLQNDIQANLGKEVSLTLQRQDQTLTVKVTPRLKPPQGQGALGITLGNAYQPVSLGEAWGSALTTAVDQAKQFVLLPVHLIEGQIAPDQARLVGIKGIFDIYSQAGQLDAQAAASTPSDKGLPIFRMSFMAAIAIAIGLTNLLPVPALDGGRIVLLLPELFLRRRIPAQYENMVNMIGFGALLLLMAYITLQDFINPVVPH